MEGQRRAEGSPQLDNKNTLKKTKFDLRIVQSYLCRVQEQRPLLAIPVAELDTHLANFIRTHRKQDGSEYEPGTLRGILGSLDRHFEKSGYPHAIYRSRETKFQKTVSAMKEKQSYLKTIGKGNHPNHTEPLTEREIELLYSTGTIGLHNPTALLHMLFFNIGLHFSLRTMEQHSLRWGDIILKADAQGRKYLEHTKRLTPGRTTGKPHPSLTMKMQIYESPEQPERDVVKAYEKYSVERPEKMKCKDAPFYLTPQPDCRPGYARWFKNLPMGETRIRSIMKNLKMAAGLSPQRKISNHCVLKSPHMKGNGMSVPFTPKMKPQRESQSTNGCRSNGHPAVKKEDPCTSDHGSDTETPRKPRRGIILPASFTPDPTTRKIKEEWEPEEKPCLGGNTEDKGSSRGQGSVTFHDVAACFSAEEWSALEEWQKDLYKKVMQEIHSALEGMGYKILNTDLLLKIKDEDVNEKSPVIEKRDSVTGQGGNITPDILLRIKQDDMPDWKDVGGSEKEEELDASSSSIPVFDPDLSLWIFRDVPDMSPPDNEKDQVLPTDTEDGAPSSHSSPSSFKEPLPAVSTFCSPVLPAGPRACKRKRRPPQRRSSEQQPDSDTDHEEPNHRLPYRNLSAGERPDWMPHEKVYQCDLCEKSFSDRSGLQEMSLSCPQCGGSLNPHPLFSRSPCNESTASYIQTLHYSDCGVELGLSHRMQGPVG